MRRARTPTAFRTLAAEALLAVCGLLLGADADPSLRSFLEAGLQRAKRRVRCGVRQRGRGDSEMGREKRMKRCVLVQEDETVQKPIGLGLKVKRCVFVSF